MDIEGQGEHDKLKSGESGGAKPDNKLIKSLRELLRLRSQGINVSNAPSEKIEEVTAARRNLRPAGIQNPISNN